jgi:hypothetical protein
MITWTEFQKNVLKMLVTWMVQGYVSQICVGATQPCLLLLPNACFLHVT